jgi:hypothetical protein
MKYRVIMSVDLDVSVKYSAVVRYFRRNGSTLRVVITKSV